MTARPRRRQRWMSTDELLKLFELGLTFDEIGDINKRKTGWKPTRSTVSVKYKDLGQPPRRTRHIDLIPWTVRPEHHGDRLRHYLRAESKKRAGRKLTPDEQSAVNVLHQLLFGRGRLMVVGYHSEVGFFLTERAESDADIIRVPVPVADNDDAHRQAVPD